MTGHDVARVDGRLVVTASVSSLASARRAPAAKSAIPPIVNTGLVEDEWLIGELQIPQQLTLNLSGCRRYKRGGLCGVCGGRVRGRRRYWCSDGCVGLYRSNHDWNLASWTIKLRAGWRCEQCGRRGALETNHIVPVNGGRRDGCAAHQEGLEALCHECHGAETARQRREGLIG